MLRVYYKGKNCITVKRIADSRELNTAFKLRYKVYLQNNYIVSSEERLDQDQYDNESVHFAAFYSDEMIGYCRLILTDPLPTESDCFKFAEPNEISKIPRTSRGELSRLIVDKEKVVKINIPRHLIMLSLFKAMVIYSDANDIKGGYSFVKKKLLKKLKRIFFPIKQIKKFKQIYSQEKLKNYFEDRDNPVWPVYYTLRPLKTYLGIYFDSGLFFKKTSKGYVKRW